jgi:hypothetical protein
VYWIVYLVLPTVAGLLISQKGCKRYFVEDAPGIVRVLRWLAAAYAYLWLLTDVLPTDEAQSPVLFQVETGGTPTAASALSRLLTSLPALLLLVVISIAAALLWMLGALAVLVQGRMPAAISEFLTMTLRYQFRLASYHLSLVERYPSFDTLSVPRDAFHSGAAVAILAIGIGTTSACTSSSPSGGRQLHAAQAGVCEAAPPPP